MKLKRILKKGIMGCANVLALLMVIQTSNSTCIWVVHQPKFSEEAQKLKKYNFSFC